MSEVRLIASDAYSVELRYAIADSVRAAAEAARAWHGRGDKVAADEAAVAAMRAVLADAPFDGTVVIGEGEKDEAPMLANGERLGRGSSPSCDVAVDPLDGTRLTAEGLPGSVCVIALAPRGALFDPRRLLHGQAGLLGGGRGSRLARALPRGERAGAGGGTGQACGGARRRGTRQAAARGADRRAARRRSGAVAARRGRRLGRDRGRRPGGRGRPGAGHRRDARGRRRGVRGARAGRCDGGAARAADGGRACERARGRSRPRPAAAAGGPGRLGRRALRGLRGLRRAGTRKNVGPTGHHSNNLGNLPPARLELLKLAALSPKPISTSQPVEAKARSLNRRLGAAVSQQLADRY
ncbi:fructose-bisphosphatase class II [Rathayibacter sp. SD072]|nr:fructose-bisphosphatase class II [Rathayibacter sp. SD072]